MPSTQYDRLVVAAVIKRGESFLVCQRPAHKRHGGLWEFPGGKLEEGETLLQAAQRELFEELELHVTDSLSRLLFTSRDAASGYEINFLEVHADGDPILNEHAAYAWLPAGSLLEYELAPSDKEFVEFLADAN